MLEIKIGSALLAFFACTAAAYTDDERYKRHPKRYLRRGTMIGEKHQLANDLTEDVAFWTRTLQYSLPPAPTPGGQ
jgi:hypothetical protein